MDINISLIIGTIINFAILILGVIGIFLVVKSVVKGRIETNDRLASIEEKLENIEKKK